MRAIFYLNGILVRVLCVLAAFLVAAMVFSISAEVILRIFGFPSIHGLIELTEYAMFISTFFVAPYLLKTNEHIRVDLIIARIKPDQARRVECSVMLVIMAVSLVTFVVATILMVRSIQEETLIFKDLIFPQWWLDWIIPLSSFAMLLQALEMFLALLRQPGEPMPVEGVPGIQSGELS